MHVAGRRRLLFLTTCSGDSKPYMILVALIKGFQNHMGFVIIRASGEEWLARDQRGGKSTGVLCGPERVNVKIGSKRWHSVLRNSERCLVLAALIVVNVVQHCSRPQRVQNGVYWAKIRSRRLWRRIEPKNKTPNSSL